MQFGSHVRRSSRIAKQIPLIVRWQPPGRDIEDDPAKTVLLSKHGCSLTCRIQLKIGGQIYVHDPGSGKSARARVVYRRVGKPGEETEAAIEFLGVDSFWGTDFPARPQFAPAGA